MARRSSHPDFYTDPLPWEPPRNCYPTNDDVIRYYVSHMIENRDKNIVRKNLAEFVKTIWEEGDGCPKTCPNIEAQFDELFHIYGKYKCEGRGTKGGHKKKHTDEPPKQPTRKSRRLCGTEEDPLPDTQASNEDAATIGDPDTSPPAKKSRSSSARLSVTTNPHKDVWMEDYGRKLFDVKSKYRLKKVSECKKDEVPETFDSEYYFDQLDPGKRKKYIQVMKVTKEYLEQQQAIQQKLARKAARTLSAMGKDGKVEEDEDEDEDEPSSQSSNDTMPEHGEASVSTAVSSEEVCFTMETRNSLSKDQITGRISKNTQTEPLVLDEIDTFPSTSTRMKRNGRACHPSYLQSGLLMMALNNESSNQAVMNMYIHDTVVYKQNRMLPIRLRKDYQRQLHLLKKYVSALKRQRKDGVLSQIIPESHPEENEIVENQDTEATDIVPESLPEETEVVERQDTEATDIAPESLPEETEVVERQDEESWDDVVDDDSDDDQTNHLVNQLRSAETFVMSTKQKQKDNRDIVLPDPRSVRYAHQVASCFLEGEIGLEIVKHKKTYLMPDGTSRSKVGKMGGCLVHIEDKIRALKLQKMGKDTRENWADTIIHKLQRLSTASDKSIQEIYEAVRGIVSDAHSVNKGLAAEISGKLGLEWIPGQLYCCIHTVLGFQEGMVKVWLRYQEKIGYDKMYPSITGFELDMEDKSLVKQILECNLRLTADRWQARSWNRYDAFSKFCKDQGKNNLGQELHGNRFGDLEKCCAIGIYSIEMWVDFINVRSEVRNDLAIFLRDTQHLSDICTLLWLGPALLGIHLTEPYLSLLIDRKATHLDLLRIFPQLYRELSEGTSTIAQVKSPAFPSLQDAWIDPLSEESPYKKEVGVAISEAIDRCDKEVLENYMKELCREMAIILKRQRGNAYDFGDDKNSPELVTRIFSKEELKKAPTHSRDIENLFGVEDSVLTRFGAQAFEKSSDDMVIKYSHDLLPSPKVWCTAKNRKMAKVMKEQQKEFDLKQSALLEAGVSLTEAEILSKDTQIQKFVQQCRDSHQGPLKDPEEVDNLVKRFNGNEKLLRSALTKEIRYRKYSSHSIKFNNPLFSQRNCEMKRLIENLKLLLMKTDVTMAARATMADLEAVIATPTTNSDDEGDVDEDGNLTVAIPEGSTKDTNQSEAHESESSAEEDIETYKIGEHIAANFCDGFYIGEIVEKIDDDTYKVSYMSPKTIATADCNEHKRRFWYWPSKKDVFNTDTSCILNLKPVISLATPPSTKRVYVFACHNAKLLEIIANSVSEEI